MGHKGSPLAPASRQLCPQGSPNLPFTSASQLVCMFTMSRLLHPPV